MHKQHKQRTNWKGAMFPKSGYHANLHLGGDEEAADANELQSGLEHVALCGHEAVKVVLGQVI